MNSEDRECLEVLSYWSRNADHSEFLAFKLKVMTSMKKKLKKYLKLSTKSIPLSVNELISHFLHKKKCCPSVICIITKNDDKLQLLRIISNCITSQKVTANYIKPLSIIVEEKDGSQIFKSVAIPSKKFYVLSTKVYPVTQLTLSHIHCQH